MQETTNETVKPKNPFKRAARIGFNFFDNRDMKAHYYKIEKYEVRANKDGEENPFFDAIDLETGEQGSIYIDGGMKGQMSKAGGPQALVGKGIELKYKGMVPVTMQDERGKTIETEVNSWDVFLLDLTQ